MQCLFVTQLEVGAVPLLLLDCRCHQCLTLEALVLESLLVNESGNVYYCF